MTSARRQKSTAATSSTSRTSATSPARSKTSSWTSSRACTVSTRSASPSTSEIPRSSGASRRATSARRPTSRPPEHEQLDWLVDRPGALGAAVALEGGEPARERPVRDRLERREPAQADLPVVLRIAPREEVTNDPVTRAPEALGQERAGQPVAGGHAPEIERERVGEEADVLVLVR